MPWSQAVSPWLIHSAVISLLVLAVGSGAVLLCRPPARRVRIIELNPLVWWLRRQLRLCQDFLADDRAARQTAQPEDYAEFLTAWAATGSLGPVVVGLGMRFSKSELYRRVVMLVQNQSLESRPPRPWTVTATCVALFLVAAMPALTNAPRAAAGAAPVPLDAASSFVARLPEGITIELLGVSTHPSNEKSWWRPDGSPLAEPPCDPLKGSVSSSTNYVAREIALRLRGVPAEAVGTQVKFEPACDSFTGVSPTSHGKTAPGLQGMIVSLPDQPAVTVRVGVAAGPWRTIYEDKKGAWSTGTPEGTFVVSPIIEKGGSITVTIACNIVGPESRLVAVGLDGREHSADQTSAGGAAEFHQITATFSGISLEDIKTFRLQSRPYKWIEFRNVSLQPGKKTDVRIDQSKAPGPSSSSAVRRAQIELLEGPDVLVIRGKREDVRRITESVVKGRRVEEQPTSGALPSEQGSKTQPKPAAANSERKSHDR